MGLFSRPAAPSVGLELISRDRIRKVLDTQGWPYQVDAEGNISAVWNDGAYAFLIFGREREIFTVRATWLSVLKSEDTLRAHEFCARWNKEKLWPKVYPKVDVEGRLRLHGEHNMDYESGLSDAQLLSHIRTMYGSGTDFFEHAAKEFPHALPVSPSDIDRQT